MSGCIYGIGVGPGDPELMTVKAIKRLKDCQVLAIPHTDKERCTAYQIAVRAIPEIAAKPCLNLPMPMTKDQEVLNESHEKAASFVIEYLEQGLDVGFITLGDVSIYSTAVYLLKRIADAGYQTGLVSGIPSFCAAAARMNTALVSGAEELHIIPATYQTEDALNMPGVKVLMKTGKQMKSVKEQIKKCKGRAVMVENCGMPDEKVYRSLEDIPDDPGYYSLLIVRS